MKRWIWLAKVFEYKKMEQTWKAEYVQHKVVHTTNQ